jgi:periplasmic divalent cation tolerance protein
MQIDPARSHHALFFNTAAMTPPMPIADTVLLCYCSCPDAVSAQRIADALVQERLAACVNHVPGINSTYRWDGAVTTDSEALLLIKTTAARFEALTARLLELHPYDLPELIAVPVERGHAAYLEWVRANVTG